MKVLIASDSFKGSLSSLDAGESIRRGFLRVFPHSNCKVLPVADGGEGTVEALAAALGGASVAETVTGPLGEPVEARYAVLPDGAAVIEMAAASGLTLVPEAKRDPSVTTTYGTGELIRAALDRGCRKIFIGIGGSATNDGGAGMARALGAKFLDGAGRELPPGGGALLGLERIDTSNLDKRLRGTRVIVACDVTNPLCGENGASAVYGPQKGADRDMVARLDRALENYGGHLARLLKQDIASLPGAGAAGGLGAGLIAFCGGALRSGFDEVAAMTGLEALVRDSDLVLSGEGMIDLTSVNGKVLSGLGGLAQKYGRPLIAFCGGMGPGAEKVYGVGVSAVAPIVPGPMPLSEALENAAGLLAGASERAARLLRAGKSLM